MTLRTRLPPGVYSHYRYRRPLHDQAGHLTGHWRRVDCREVECPHYLLGWYTDVDETTDFGQAQASYMRTSRRRHCKEEHLPSGLTRFHFEPGQTCFRSTDTGHWLATGMPPIYSKDRQPIEFERFTDGMNEDSYRHHKRRQGG